MGKDFRVHVRQPFCFMMLCGLLEVWLRFATDEAVEACVRISRMMSSGSASRELVAIMIAHQIEQLSVLIFVMISCVQMQVIYR